MKKNLWFSLILSLHYMHGFAQCTCFANGTKSPPSTLTPTSAWQTTVVWGGDYTLFNVLKGKIYTWSFCTSDGGSSAFDTRLNLFNNSDTSRVTCNGDYSGCGLAAKIIWTADFNGVVRVKTNVYFSSSNQCGINIIPQTTSTLAYNATCPTLTAPTAPSPGTTSGPGPALASTTPILTWSGLSTGTYHVQIWDAATVSPNDNNVVYGFETSSAPGHCVTGLTHQVQAGYLVNNGKYKWSVHRNDPCGECESTPTSLSYFQISLPCTAPPAPGNFTATSVSSSQINLSWDPVAGATDYEVDFSLGSCPWGSGGITLITTHCNACTTAVATGLSPSTTYRFIVVAKNCFGFGTANSCVSAATLSTCNYSISPTSNNLVPATGVTNANVSVTTQNACSWSSSNNGNSWITVNGSGTGNGTAVYSIPPYNGTSSRNGSMTIAGSIFNIMQEGVPCTPPANPANPSSNSPQSGNVTITRSGTPPSGETWYWQGTSCGTTKTLGSGTTFTATASGTYYLRSVNASDCWSSGCGSCSVTVNSIANDITGTVYNYSSVNATASLLPDASIDLRNSSGSVLANTTTNSSGNFKFSGLSGSNYQIRAGKGTGSYSISATTTNLNPGANLPEVKLPYNLHQDVWNANAALKSHLFNYDLGYIVTLPVNMPSYDVAAGSTYLQSSLATFNSNIDKKIESLQRMLALCRTLKVIDDNGANMLQHTSEELVNAAMMVYGTESFVKHFDRLLAKEGINPVRYLFFKLQRAFITTASNTIKKIVSSAASFIKDPGLRSIIQKTIDESFALIQKSIDSDNQRAFEDDVIADIAAGLIKNVFATIFYEQYFINQSQYNFNQSITGLGTLNFTNSTPNTVSDLNQIQANSANSYTGSYPNFVYWSAFAEGLATGRKIFTLGKWFVTNPYALVATQVSSAFLGIGAYASEIKAILVGADGVLLQKNHAITACNNSLSSRTAQSGFSLFTDTATNDSLHYFFSGTSSAITILQNENYSLESSKEYAYMDSCLTNRINNLIDRLNIGYAAKGDSISENSFYKFLKIATVNLNLRSNLCWLISAKLIDIADPKLSDSLAYYSAIIKANNNFTDSVLTEASVVSSSMLSPAYFKIEKVICPAMADTGTTIPVTVILKLHSDTAIAAQLYVSNVNDTLANSSKIYSPNISDTVTFLIASGGRDTSFALRVSSSNTKAIDASQSIILRIQSKTTNISIIGSNILCVGDSAILIANTPAGYAARWKDEYAGNFVGWENSLTIYGGTTGRYRALFIDTTQPNNYYYSTNSIDIRNSVPDLGRDKSIGIVCPGDIISIGGIYNTTGLATHWNTSTPNAVGPGIYKLIVTNADGCKDTAIVSVKMDVANWIGGISDDWHNPANWSGNSVPRDSTHVIIGPSLNPCIVSNHDAVFASMQVRPGGIYQVKNHRMTSIKSNCLVLPGVSILPVVNTLQISNILNNTASGGGTVISTGDTVIAARGICWNTAQLPTIADTKSSDGAGIGSFTSSITGLTPNTKYYVRAYATNSAGTIYGNEVNFTTAFINSVMIGSQRWTDKNLEVNAYRNGDTIPQVANPTQWANLTTGAWCYFNNDAANGAVYGKLYNWYAVNDPRGLAPQGWHVPSDSEWATLGTFLGGTTTAGGKMKSTTLWNSPNTGATNESGFSGLPGSIRWEYGPFPNYLNTIGYWWTSNKGQLHDNTAWSYRLKHNVTELFRDEVYMASGFSVRCLKNTIPSILTAPVTTVSANSAIAGGTILSDNGSAVTTRGVCYALNSNPTIANSTVISGISSNVFSVTLTGLASNTTYYMRAYAMNDVGTAYGNQITFTTAPPDSVIIGTRVWEAKNLQVAAYKNGDLIPQVTDPSQWANLSSGAWCFYNNDSINGPIYGKLYNGFAVDDPRGLAPEGWHVPRDTEWDTLTSSLGGDLIAGGKLKAITLWNSPNTGATNESGFAAMPGGYRNIAGDYLNLGSNNWLWGSVQYPFSTATTLTLFYNDSRFIRNNNNKKNGFSVRCIKNSLPSVITTSVTTIMTNSVSIGGNVSSDNGSPVTARGICYSTISNPTLTNTNISSGTGIGIFTTNLTNLTANTTYYVRSFAINSLGTSYGNQVSFTTTPMIDTVAIGNQVWMKKNLNIITYRNGDTIPQVTDPNLWPGLTTGAWAYYNNDPANEPIYGKLYNWFAVNDPRGLAPQGWNIPTDSEWTTLSTFLGTDAIAGGKMKATTTWQNPNVGATNLSGFTALAAGFIQINPNRFINLSQTCHWWSSTSNSPTSAWYRNIAYSTGNLYRNFFDKVHGFSVRCIRSAVLAPVIITTTPVSAITVNSATSGGNILSDGGAPITERGICYSTAVTPTVANSKAISGTGIGIFTVNLPTLLANTHYYVRAYATSSIGTIYGNEVSFTTNELLDTVLIGTQGWMKKNLDVVTYRNGDTIPQVTDPNVWTALTTGAWCYYNNDPANGTTHGKLYNGYAVMDPRGLAPTGWHIPSEAEWTILTNYLGGYLVAGGKMKSTSLWNLPNIGATNESRYTAFATGTREGTIGFGSTFLRKGDFSMFWSTTSDINSPTMLISHYLYTNEVRIYMQLNTPKLYGYPVRCIKD